MKQILIPFTSYKYLLSQLVLREIKARYKQSIIGYAWIILNPLSQVIVYTFVFSVILKFSLVNIPYPIFLFSGLLPWIFLQTALTSGTTSLVDNSDLLKKVSFSREVLPYSSVFSKIVDLLIASSIFLIFLIYYQINIGLSALLLIPIFIIQLILIIGLSLLFSALNLFYRDIKHLITLLLMLWMYLTPIVYPITQVPEKFLFYYKLNPMVAIIEGYRSAILQSPWDWKSIILAALISLLIFIIGYSFFKKSEKVFADIV